jgi:hypothetical protein
VRAPLLLPAPAWATAVDGEARDGITWRRVSSIKPLVNDDVVGRVRSEMEVTVEREDLIQREGDGFVLVEGQLLVFAGDEWFDLEQARRLHAALGELLDLVDVEGGAR